MAQEQYQLTEKGAQIYEQHKVRAIFRPLAEATLQKVSLICDDLVLDVACGTGIVGRVIAEKYPSLSRIVGIDLNAGMIKLAGELTQGRSQNFEWYAADVSQLPFEDNRFTIAFCQQSLQFFPKKVESLAEIRRVLKPNGRLVLTVWAGTSPLFKAISDSLKTYVSAEAANRALAPSAYRDRDLIQKAVEDAGFSSVSISPLQVKRKIGPAKESISREISGHAVGPVVLVKGAEVMAKIVADVALKLAKFQTSEGFEIPQTSHLIQAYKRPYCCRC